MSAGERIIDRDIEFYTGCLQFAQQRFARCPAQDEPRVMEIVRNYSAVLLALQQLAITLGKENPQ